MRNLSKLLLLTATILLSVLSDAQINRANTKKSVPYRANYQRIATGSYTDHNLEIRGGTLWAWGLNNQGQLGDGSTTTQEYPVQIGVDNNWVSITTGRNTSLGIKSDGTLWAWGNNESGQLGDGTTTEHHSPMQIGTDDNWVSIVGAYNSSHGIKSDGTLWGWGYNGSGELGDGTTINRSNPVQIGSDNKWVSVATGVDYSLGLKSDGTLWAWGDNYYGLLGDGTTISRSSPVQIGTDNKWVSISANFYHSLALKSDGSLWSWGYNQYGEIGDGTLTPRNSPIQIGADNNWVSAIAGGQHSIALKSNGSLWAWGDNTFGELGNGTGSNQYSPVQIGSDTKWVSIAAGAFHCLGLQSDGSLWSWGYNIDGQLGTGTTNNQYSPVQIEGSDHTWLSIATGYYHNHGLKSDGKLWAWGDNAEGEIGDGSYIQRDEPVQITNDTRWVSVDAGFYYTLGLKSDGTLWAWGRNFAGDLGDGTTEPNRNIPIQIGTDNKWVSIVAGGDHSLGLKSDGTLWAWGWNNNGQLGDGTLAEKYSPVQIGADNNWTSISGNFLHSLGLKSDGTLWAWGDNTYGQLGDGTNINRSTPVQVGLDDKWISISASEYSSYGLRSDGTLWAWGDNMYGQLGDGTSVQKNTPIQIGTDNNWISIRGSSEHVLALKSNGTIWGWGVNYHGELGNINTLLTSLPIQSGTDKWVNIETGAQHSVGLKPARSQFCATGGNNYGQLGDNTTIDKPDFVCSTNSNCILPSPPTAAGVTICYSDPFLLTANGTGTIGWYDAATGGTWLGTGSNFARPTLTSTTTYYVQDSTCGASATRTAVIVTVNTPLTVSNITGSTSVCGIAGTSTIAHYVIDDIPGATYSWTKSSSLMQFVSATNTSSVDIAFSNNFTTGILTVIVSRPNSCGNVTKTIAITKKVPVAPLAIIGNINPCAYTGTASGSTTAVYTIRQVANATSYIWTVPPDVTIVGGMSPFSTIDTSINVSFPAAFSSGAIQVQAHNACGTGTAKSLILVAKQPAVPGTITGPIDVCNAIGTATDAIYSIRKVPNANSYEWQVPAGAAITSAISNDTSITVSFPGSYTTGAIKVRALSGCGNSLFKSLTVAKKLPTLPGVITAAGNVCTSMFTGTSTVTYTIPANTALPLPTSYVWTLAPAIANSAAIVSGSGTVGTPTATSMETTGLSIQVQYYGSYTTGSLSVVSKKACGSSATARKLTITKNLPPTPGVPTASGSICSGVASSVTYTVATNANTDQYIWTSPAGTKIVGSRTASPTRDTTAVNSITVNYPTTFVSGSITVKARSVCGMSAAVTLPVARVACFAGNIVKTMQKPVIEQAEQTATGTIYPNPNDGNFSLQIRSANTIDDARILISDILGQVVANYARPNNKGNIVLVVNDGKLKNGVYFLQYTIGKEMKTLKFIVQH